MKTIKSILLLLFICAFSIQLSAQKMYLVHEDKVNPSKMVDYEKAALTFHEACLKHQPDANWLTVTMDDFRYLYVSPIENFADIDKRPFADMAKTMGDEFGKMFDDFDKCYESHGDYIIMLDESLTYMPDGISQTQEGLNHRNFYFIHFTPENEKALREGMKAVKNMFTSKESKNYYRVYRSGFGVMNSYYMVAMSSEDEVDAATKNKVNDELLGPERYETFQKVIGSAAEMYEITGNIRPMLSYKKKEE